MEHRHGMITFDRLHLEIVVRLQRLLMPNAYAVIVGVSATRRFD
jgi:hypothetical protein